MKRLVFCFDGTWNRLDASCPTNVVITAESVLPLSKNRTAQLIYYGEGVGTEKWERLRGGMFGSGLVQNLADAYRFLIFNHSPGDEIFIFGFSRGAYTARSFAGLLNTCGILLRRNAAQVRDAISLYQARDTSDDFKERVMLFRSELCPQLCVSDAEQSWRKSNVADFDPAKSPKLNIRYVGVWDTVGALGIPKSFSVLNLTDKRYAFHDVALSPFVRSARHAVAIDEHRKDFVPTLWSNLAQLNADAGADESSDDAPYQQRWFPGTHSSVGGGGERRGLSDQALDWILDGARAAGLELDTSRYSRIYELAPDYTEYIENSIAPSLMYRAMHWFSTVRDGPTRLFEVSLFARRRWAAPLGHLRDGVVYRPPTLKNVETNLAEWSRANEQAARPEMENSKSLRYELHVVAPGDTLSGLAKKYYGDAMAYPRIFDANRNKLDDPNKIYVGASLRIPIDES